MSRNWDTDSADSCTWGKLDQKLCEGCRDYVYCHRQLSINDIMEEEGNDNVRGSVCIEVPEHGMPA